MQRVSRYQQALELDLIQELKRGCDFSAGIGSMSALVDRHAKAVGVEAHLWVETHCAGGVLRDRVPQSPAVTHQSVDSLTISDLGIHQGMEQAVKDFQVELSKEWPEGRPMGAYRCGCRAAR